MGYSNEVTKRCLERIEDGESHGLNHAVLAVVGHDDLSGASCTNYQIVSNITHFPSPSFLNPQLCQSPVFLFHPWLVVPRPPTSPSSDLTFQLCGQEGKLTADEYATPPTPTVTDRPSRVRHFFAFRHVPRRFYGSYPPSMRRI